MARMSRKSRANSEIRKFREFEEFGIEPTISSMHRSAPNSAHIDSFPAIPLEPESTRTEWTFAVNRALVLIGRRVPYRPDCEQALTPLACADCGVQAVTGACPDLMEGNMKRLTDSQLIVLSRATQRDDGVATPPANMRGGGLAKVGQTLVDRKLMRLIRTKPGMPVWRIDSEDRSFSLLITAAGRKMIKVGGEPADQRAAPQKIENAKSAPSGVDATAEDGADLGPHIDSGRLNESSQDDAGTRVATPLAGTKRALLIEMLSRAEGAAISEMVEAMDWLPHTIRAALTGLRHRGFGIDRCRRGGKTTYRITKAEAVGHVLTEPEG
jgi:hypothetical protein